jgi:hypothetical protein
MIRRPSSRPRPRVKRRARTPGCVQKPKQEFVPDRSTERVRKKVERKYEKGKLGAKL